MKIVVLLSLALVLGCHTAPQSADGPSKSENGAATSNGEGNVEKKIDVESDRPTETDQEPDVHYVPTPHDIVEMMLHLARVKRSDLVYDLGCGDGRIVVAAAKKYGCRAIGFDIDPARVRESLINVEKSGVGHLVAIKQQDVFTLDLAKVDVVTLFLLPSLNVRLIPQLDKMKPGCRIVSHEFDMVGVRPDAVMHMYSTDDQQIHEIYLWTTPLKKGENHDDWGVEDDEEGEEEDDPTEADRGDSK
jgi:SAM-dependent methyltransferase